MPKEIRYTQCDCEKGKLEQIAETKERIISCSVDNDRYRTIFYGCNSCSSIFTRTKKVVMTDDGVVLGERFSPFELYKGLLTKDYIKAYAPKYETLDREVEEQILTEKVKGAERKLEKRY